MRTFVRVLALIAVIGIGLLLFFGGAVVILLQQCPQEYDDAVSAPGSDSAPLGPEQLETILKWAPLVNEIRRKRATDQLSQSERDSLRDMAEILKATDEKKILYMTCEMHPEVKADKPGKCPKCGMPLLVYWTCAMHPEVKADKSGNCPKCGMRLVVAHVTAGAPPVSPSSGGTEFIRSLAEVEAAPPMVAGLVLIFSGIILAAVRPRQRQVLARPVLGNAAVLASMAQARPAVAPAPEPMPEPQAPPARPAAPTLQRAMPVSAVWKGRAMKNALLIVGIALIGIGLLVSLVGACQHNPRSSSSPGSRGGFYSSSSGDATAIIAGGVLILITGAGLVVVAQFLRRGGTPDR